MTVTLALTVLSAVLSGYDGARLERGLTQGANRVADSADSGACGGRARPCAVCADRCARTGQDGAAGGGRLARRSGPRCPRRGEHRRAGACENPVDGQQGVWPRLALQSQASELGSNWVQGFGLDAEDRILAQLRTVTPQQVQSVAQRYFGDDQLTVAIAAPAAGGRRTTPQHRTRQRSPPPLRADAPQE